jgi:uncharacterized RDD family membrane protein YckC
MLGGRPSAGFWPRLGAGLVDWFVVLGAMWLAIVVAAVLGADAWGDPALALSYAVVLLLPLLYFGFAWARSGQTLGLRATDLRLVSASTGEQPSRPRALLRASVAVVTFIAWLLPLVAGFGDASGLAALVGVGVTVAVLALVGHLWALLDPRGQSLQDRLFGLAVVPASPDR